MTSRVENIIDTDLKTIRNFREVHKTAEFNAFIEEAAKQAAIRESGGRKGDVKLENERNTHKRIDEKKDEKAEKEKEAKKAFEEMQKKMLSTPTPPPPLYDDYPVYLEENTTEPFDNEAWERLVTEDIEESFKIFDINGDGKISLHEVKAIMQSVGKDITAEDAQDIVELIDEDGDGEICYEEFKNLMYEKMSQATIDEDLIECFNIFDSDGDSYISPLEVQILYQKLGEIITLDEAVEIMSDCDLNKDGLIDFEEFKAFYAKIAKQQMDAASTANKIEKGELIELNEGNGEIGEKNRDNIYNPGDYH